MLLEEYKYRYALVPYEVAARLGLGWRKVTPENMVLLNQSELKELPGDTLEDKIAACGGTVLTAEEAAYLSKTTTFSAYKPVVAEEPTVPQMSLGPANPVEDKPTTLPLHPGEEQDNPTVLPISPEEEC